MVRLLKRLSQLRGKGDRLGVLHKVRLAAFAFAFLFPRPLEGGSKFLDQTLSLDLSEDGHDGEHALGHLAGKLLERFSLE